MKKTFLLASQLFLLAGIGGLLPGSLQRHVMLFALNILWMALAAFATAILIKEE